MTTITRPQQQRRPSARCSLVGLFLANALILACCMFWYAICYTGTTTPSSKHQAHSQYLSRASYGGGGGASTTSRTAKKQKLRFHRPLSIGEVRNNNNADEEEEEANALEEYEGPSGKLDVDGGNADPDEEEPDEEEPDEEEPEEEEPEEEEPVHPREVLNKSGQRKDVKNDAVGEEEQPQDERIRQAAEEEHACSNYKAVLHIQSGDKGAAAGTLFFQYVINQLLYAEMYNLMPVIHLNNITHNVYDEDIHGGGTGLNWTVPGVWTATWISNKTRPEIGSWPGRPYQIGVPKETKLWFRGTGVWNHYLEPVSLYDPSHDACRKLPYVALAYEQLNPGIQFYSPWGVRSWMYSYVPQYLRTHGAKNGTFHGWFGPQRTRAHEIVQKYYRFKPNLVHAAQELVPDGTNCLAVHIRHSDKGGLARKKIPTEAFLPYIDAYLNNGGDKVYLATDSSKVLGHVYSNWTHVNIIAQGGIVRSNKFQPVFRMSSHNRTNTEVLVDILAMARCQFMIHGYSAVSESSHYVNPTLHNQSVDLEDPMHMSTALFGELVKSVLQRDRD